MEIGASGVLLNTAIAQAEKPDLMATAMKLGVQAGRISYLSGSIVPQKYAQPSSPLKNFML
jgi:thiazole synthase